MPYIDKNRFESNTCEWETPDSIFAPLQKEFEFTLDVCATKENAKCEKYFTQKENALEQRWTGICWMNPPFGQQLKAWVKKAHNEARGGAIVVCLLPARTNTIYWHEYILNKAKIRYIKGYPKFGNAKQGLKVPLAIVIFGEKVL